MSKSFDQVELLVGDKVVYTNSFSPYDPILCNFLDAFSKELNKKSTKVYPDLKSLSFWCRKKNIDRIKKNFLTNEIRAGKGLIFHIAPSNVPTNFMYSLIFGLLTGNSNIVRVPSKSFNQVKIICNLIKDLLKMKKFNSLKKNIKIVKYGNENENFTKYISSLCDVRIIWGGDKSIENIRRFPIKSRSFDLTFADRYSFCIVKASEYLKNQGKKKIAFDFYNDTYLFDQNGCSAPRLIYWVGNSRDIFKAKEIFWKSLHEVLLEKKYIIQSMTAVNKYSASCNAALDYNNVTLPIAPDNLISRVELNSLYADVTERTCAGGSYFEYSDQALDKLLNFVSRKFQTLTYIGFKRGELVSFFAGKRIVGLDRIVPCGRASAFGLIWDGYDMIRHMSRVVSIE